MIEKGPENGMIFRPETVKGDEKPYLSPMEILKQRLSEGGFSVVDFDPHSSFNEFVHKKINRETIDTHYDLRSLQFLSSCADDPTEKLRIFHFITSVGFLIERFHENLNMFLLKNEGNVKMMDDARKVVKKTINVDSNNGLIGNSSIENHLNRLLVVMLEDRTYSLFNHDPEELSSKMLAFVQKFNPMGIDRVLEFIQVSQFAEKLVKGADSSLIPKLIRFTLSKVVTSNDRAELISKLGSGEIDWVKKIKLFLKLFAQEGRNVVSEKLFEEEALNQRFIQEVDSSPELSIKDKLEEFKKLSSDRKFRRIWWTIEKMSRAERKSIRQRLNENLHEKGAKEVDGISKKALTRIKKRENLLHPLNTLNLAVPVGYEVEFNKDENFDNLDNSFTIDMLEIIGFASGTGGGNAAETSPGPFFDPLTAITVFNLYADSQIIDLHTRRNQTMHFNVGLREEKSHAEILKLVRALYSAGYSFSPQRPQVGYETLTIVSKKSGNPNEKLVHYTEAKAFDVVSRQGFAWTMKAASLLSWGIAASMRCEDKNYTPNVWDQKLSKIWEGYKKEMSIGLDPILGEDYLSVPYKSDPRFVAMKGQLGAIFPDVEALYKDLSKINKKTNPRIVPIKVGKRRYSNMAHFGYQVTKKYVKEVEKIAVDVEREVKKDIEKIDLLTTGLVRRFYIMKFLNKYKTSISKFYSYELAEETYLKVRGIFKK